MYILKERPEDFRVEEVSNIELENGSYAVYKLTKRNIGSEPAIGILCKEWNLQRKHVGYAGLKDKNAITIQYISVLKGKRKDQSFGSFEIEFMGYAKKGIALGELKENKFEIVVRNIDEQERKTLEKNCVALKKRKFMVPNYFDEQRFSKNNAEIGKLLIKKEFKKAIEIMLQHEAHTESYEKEVRQAWEKNKSNPIQALRLVPKKILSLYVNAYQSLLFNHALKAFLEKHGDAAPSKAIEFPLVGYGTVLSSRSAKQKEIKILFEGILEREKVTLRDFVVHSFPELSSFGSMRKAFCKADGFSCKIEKDELHEGMEKAILKFSLQKGSYATRVVKELFEQSPIEN